MSPDPLPSAETCARKRRRFARGFFKSREGATVIEFALLALPFLLLTFAILETCISYAAGEYVQNVTDDVAREFRVGRLRQGGITQGELRTKICDRLEIFVSKGCPGLSVDLRSFDTFAEANTYSWNITEKKIHIDGGFQFTPGKAQSKNMLRVFYRWPVMTDIMRARMTNLEDNAVLLMGTATWQNEPFEDL